MRMETKTQTIHMSRYENPAFMEPQPRIALISQNSGCTRTSTPRMRKFRSYSVRVGSKSMRSTSERLPGSLWQLACGFVADFVARQTEFGMLAENQPWRLPENFRSLGRLRKFGCMKEQYGHVKPSRRRVHRRFRSRSFRAHRYDRTRQPSIRSPGRRRWHQSG